MEDMVITAEGLARLQAELAELRTTAREDEPILERRIALLEDAIARATVVEPDAGNGRVDVGERVTVRDLDSGDVREYELVGPLEAAPAQGRISTASPLGQALVGGACGDEIAVEAPRGRLRFEIVAISGLPQLAR